MHELATLQQKHSLGRVMRAETLHLTLLFLGDTPAERLPELLAAASKVQSDEFKLKMDRMACWKHNRIVYMAPSQPPEALPKLVEQLGMRVSDAGFRFDRKSFVPHVTLLRKIESAPVMKRITPLIWPVRDFSLMQTVMDVRGARYETLGRWQLA